LSGFRLGNYAYHKFYPHLLGISTEYYLRGREHANRVRSSECSCLYAQIRHSLHRFAQGLSRSVSRVMSSNSFKISCTETCSTHSLACPVFEQDCHLKLVASIAISLHSFLTQRCPYRVSRHKNARASGHRAWRHQTLGLLVRVDTAVRLCLGDKLQLSNAPRPCLQLNFMPREMHVGLDQTRRLAPCHPSCRGCCSSSYLLVLIILVTLVRLSLWYPPSSSPLSLVSFVYGSQAIDQAH